MILPDQQKARGGILIFHPLSFTPEYMIDIWSISTYEWVTHLNHTHAHAMNICLAETDAMDIRLL